MIRHIVFFSVRNKDDTPALVRELSELKAIPHSKTLEVAVNRRLDSLSDAVDVVVYGEFLNEAELAAYKAHPVYIETTKRARPLREMRTAADYEADADRAAGRS